MSLTGPDFITLWRVNCGPAGYEMQWAKDAPTSCLGADGFFVNAKARRTVSEQSLMVKQEVTPEGKTPTGGRNDAESKSLTCPVGDSLHDFSWPFPVSLTKLHGLVDATFQGDSFSVSVAPDSAVANLDADVSVGESVLKLDTVDHVYPGLAVALDDTQRTDNLGRVSSVDQGNVTVTVSAPVTQGFLRDTPTKVLGAQHIVTDYVFGAAGGFAIGDSHALGTYLDAGTVVRLTFRNQGSVDKMFYPTFEYLY